MYCIMNCSSISIVHDIKGYVIMWYWMGWDNTAAFWVKGTTVKWKWLSYRFISLCINDYAHVQSGHASKIIDHIIHIIDPLSFLIGCPDMSLSEVVKKIGYYLSDIKITDIYIYIYIYIYSILISSGILLWIVTLNFLYIHIVACESLGTPGRICEKVNHFNKIRQIIQNACCFYLALSWIQYFK